MTAIVPSGFKWPATSTRIPLVGFLIAALVLSQISPLIPLLVPPVSGTIAEATPLVGIDAPPVPAAPDLPFVMPASPASAEPRAPVQATTWQGYPEIVARRDASSRHYDLGEGRAVAVVSSQSQNYRDEEGQWHPIDARFEPATDGFAIRNNVLYVGMSNSASTALLQRGNTLVGWEPEALLILDSNGASLESIATPLHTAEDSARNGADAVDVTLSSDGHTLTYLRHWSDPTLREQFHSTPGGIEQSLILAAPPSLPVETRQSRGQWLALQANLHLLSGETLWTNGQAQEESFSTLDKEQQEIEIRNDAGEVILSLAPVVAFEESNRHQRVDGHYRAEMVEPGVWRLYVVTPLAWWTAPGRAYPAVLDPNMYVQVTQPASMTRHYNVVDDPAVVCGIRLNQDEAAEFVHIASGAIWCEVEEGEFELDTTYDDRTDIVFDPLPPLPQDAEITGATLVLDGYVFGDDFEVEIVDLASSDVIDTLDFGLADSLDGCSGSSCSLYDNPPASRTFDIDLPAGTIVPLVQNWYDGQNQGLQLRAVAQDDNNTCSPIFTVKTGADAFYECAFRSTDSPQLLIHYETSTLQAGQKVLNQAIPGYNADSFGRSGHEYSTATLPQDWSAIAVLADADANRQVYVPLEVLDKVSQKTGDNPPINRRVNFVMLDNATGQLPDTVDALVRESQSNFSGGSPPGAIPGAVYDIMWRTPHQASLQNPTTSWTSQNRGFNHGDLMGVFPFDLSAEHTLAVRVIAPDDTDIHVELFAPEPGSTDSQAGNELYDNWTAAREDSPHQVTGSLPDGNGNRIYSIMAKSFSPFVQRWALAIAHDGAHDVCPGPPPGLAAASTDASGCPKVEFTIEMLACPPGEYPTLRFGCQSLLYPHEQVGGGIIIQPGSADAPDAPDATTVPRTDFYDVGGVRIFSEGGFIGDEVGETPDADVYGDNYAICTTDEDRGMPLLGLTSDAVPNNAGQTPPNPYRLIPVQQGSICVTAGNQIHIVGTVIPASGGDEYGAVVAPSIRENNRRPVRLYNDEVELYHGQIDLGAQFGTLDAGSMIQASGNPFRFDVNGVVLVNMNPWDGWDGMPTISFPRYIEVDQRSATGEQDGTLLVTTEPKSNEESGVEVSVDSTWRRRAALGPPGFELTMEAAILPPDLDIATMDLRFHSPGSAHIPNNSAEVAEIHLSDATIHQRLDLGGAYKPVQAVIRKTGLPIRTSDISQTDDDNNLPDCGASRSCVDVRRHDNIERADWIVPDVVAGGATGMVVMQTDGAMQVFSADHPDQGLKAASFSALNADAGQFFNLKTFSAQGTTVIGECDGEQNVTVVSGHAKVSLPMLGNGLDEAPSALEASYKVCENKFREAHISFNIYPPGIPAGASGLVLESLSGDVTVSESYVQIAMSVGFRAYDGATVTRGEGGILIDTRGLFRLSGQAQLVGIFSATGSLAVGWSPLDILFEAGMTFQDWLAGSLRLHMWRGQGYGGQYTWLPDNNDFHFTGAIGATFTLKKGRIGQFWKITLPPKDIKLGVEVSFGEFCKNESCTSYEWGVQGKITILSFTVGTFVGKGPRVKFFLGDKGVKLIDQAFLAQAATLEAAPTSPISDLAGGEPLDAFAGAGEGPCPLEGGVATCSFTVDAGTGEVLISATWADGTLPTAMLHTPDGESIMAFAPGGLPMPTVHPDFGSGVAVYLFEPANSGRVQFILDPTNAFYTIENPQAGEWQLTLDNLTGFENYNVIFAANSPAPQIALTAPDDIQLNGMLDIQWTATPPGTDATVHLAYISQSDYISFTTELGAGAPITEVAGYHGGVTIAPNVPVANGSFQWQPVGLASGAYYVVARIDHPIHGSSYAFSPGPFTYTDSTAPAPPSGLRLTSAFDLADAALIASWDRSSESDLSAYELAYNSPDGEGGFVERLLRVPPSDRLLNNPERERVRLSALVEGIETTLCVRAVDSSGNVSACSESVSATPEAVTSLPLWTAPDLTTLAAQPGPTLAAQWMAGSGNDGYLLSWAYGCASTYAGPPAMEGPSNLDVGNVTSFSLTQLPPGTYRVAVRGYRLSTEKAPVVDRIGRYSNNMTVLLSDGVDGNGDGLPDDWADHFGVQGAGEDADGDNLNNGFERLHMTDPTNPDSDGDGFEDGAETFAWLTNPCDPADAPDRVQRLGVSPSGGSLRFETVAGENPFAAQVVIVRSLGAGLLPWAATASAAWIKVTPQSGATLMWFRAPDIVQVSVDASGLAPGYYEGSVRVQSNTGGPVHDSPQFVPVRLWVLRNRAPGAPALDTRVQGYVFLDENFDGVEDASETTRVKDIAVEVVNGMGGIMATALSKPNTGLFDIAQLPYAAYTLLAHHPDYLVTTQNPLPLQVTAQSNPITGLKFGVARRENVLTDTDGDGVLDGDEDTNRNGILDDDDSDGDGTPDYRDVDDDGDGVPTKLERTFGDTDEDGKPNYLDDDDDNDGVLTQDEGSGDSNGDSVPDYLDKTVAGSGGGKIYLPDVHK